MPISFSKNSRFVFSHHKIPMKPFAISLFLILYTFNISAQTVEIPDSWFRFLISYLDSNHDGIFTQAELAVEDTLYLDYHSGDIQDLSGIEYFVNLEYVYMGVGTSVQHLDLHHNTRLKGMALGETPYLRYCNISGLTELESFAIVSPLLDTFLYTNLPSLRKMELGQLRQIHSLDFSSCPHLRELQVSGVHLDSLDTENLRELEYLTLQYLPSQYEIPYNGHHLTTLDLRKSQDLKLIQIISCYDIEKILIDSLPNLRGFYMTDNWDLESLSLPFAPKLTRIHIGGTKGLETFALNQSPILDSIQLWYSPKLDSFYLSHPEKVKYLYLYEVGDSSFTLDAFQFKQVEEMNILTTALSSHPYPENPFVKYLRLGELSAIDTLKIACMPNLEELSLAASSIHYVDIHHNSALRILNIKSADSIHVCNNSFPLQDPRYTALYVYENGCMVLSDYANFVFADNCSNSELPCPKSPPAIDTAKVFILYPNPSKGDISVLRPHYNASISWKCWGVDGKLYAEKKHLCCTENIKLENMASGIYLLEITDDSGVKFWHKVVLE